MSHPTNPAADAARESARQDNGQFGVQPRSEADVELGTPALGAAACYREGSHQITSRHPSSECPVETPARSGRPLSPHLAAGLGQWPTDLPAPTFHADFTEDGQLLVEIYSGDRAASFWYQEDSIADSGEWDDIDEATREQVATYGDRLHTKLAQAHAEALHSTAGTWFRDHVIERAQIGATPSPVTDLRRLADAKGLAVAVQGRGSFETHIGRELTDAEWEALRPELDGFDDYLDKPGTSSHAEISTWRERALARSGLLYDHADGGYRNVRSASED